MKIKVSITKIMDVDDDTLDLINERLINRERNQFIESTHLDEKVK